MNNGKDENKSMQKIVVKSNGNPTAHQNIIIWQNVRAHKSVKCKIISDG